MATLPYVLGNRRGFCDDDSYGTRLRSGNSEAIRLPKDVAFGKEIEVTIIRSGDVLTIYPKRSRLHGLAARLAALPAPTEIEVRDVEPIPERPGL